MQGLLAVVLAASLSLAPFAAHAAVPVSGALGVVPGDPADPFGMRAVDGTAPDGRRETTEPAARTGTGARAEQAGVGTDATGTAATPPESCAFSPLVPDFSSGLKRLSRHAALSLGAFALSLPVVALSTTQDDAVTDWATVVRPLGGADVLGARALPPVLGGTALALAGLAIFQPDPAARARRWRELGTFAASQAVTAGLTQLLKYTVRRPRPSGPSTLSFPSGHTSAIFAWATFVWRRYGWQWGLPAFAVASFVAFSRIQDSRHYLSDVLAGALLGVSVTYVTDVVVGPP